VRPFVVGLGRYLLTSALLTGCQRGIRENSRRNEILGEI
jgi:hypothetical protein